MFDQKHQPSSLMLLQSLTSHVIGTHHGLVDEPSTLEFNQAKGVGWVGPGVLDHAPFILWGVDLHQLVCLL